MNLMINTTITEFLVHTCKFVVMVLDREKAEARVWPKLMSKLQPQIPIFQKFSLFTSLFA